MNKISICTVCMNRGHHLKETFIRNILDNQDYPNLEFILLDYNSKDDMYEWAKANLQPYIDKGLVKYYKTYDPVYFDVSHSKNLAFRLSTGDIVCMMDADNFAGVGYATWVNEQFEKQANAIITNIRHDHIPYRDQGGKIAFHRSRFENIRGFDESMTGYGIDDVDAVYRMERAGGQRVFIEAEEFLRYIPHPHLERLQNYHLLNNLENIYMQVTEHMEERNHTIYQLSDQTFYDVQYERHTLIPKNPLATYDGWKIPDNGYKKGRYAIQHNRMELQYEDGDVRAFAIESDGSLQLSVADQSTQWKPMTRKGHAFQGMVFAYSECLNRYNSAANKKEPTIVNPQGWGRGKVYQDFDEQNPITIN